MSLPNEILPVGLLGTGAADTGYLIERSLRFNSTDSAYLNRTPASAGNRKTWTWAGWVKRSRIGTAQETLFTGGNSNTDTSWMGIGFLSTDALFIGGVANNFLVTTQVFRDTSAWYHFVVALDTTQGTAANTLKIYVNGVQITIFSTDNRATKTSSSIDLGINQALAHSINAQTVGSALYGNHYLADVFFVDGQALAPTSFGKFDANGIWQPKAYSDVLPGPVTLVPSIAEGALIIKADDATITGFVSAAGFVKVHSSSDGINWTYREQILSGALSFSAKYIAIGGGSTNSRTFNPSTGGSYTWAEYSAGTQFDTTSNITLNVTGLSYTPNSTVTAPYGTNGFHLDFADNSTAAALGTDTSGNGNDWTVQNISVTAASSHSFTESGLGLISSIYQGGPFQPRSGAPTGSYPPGYNFDTGSSTVYRFTLATAGVVTVYSTTSNGYGSPTVRFPETGQSVSYGFLDGAVQTFTSSSSVTYFEWYMASPQGGQAGYLNGVDVDGVPVVVIPASSIDSLVDVPTNGTETDTGVGSEVRGNYCTLNPLQTGTSLSNGNLDSVAGSTAVTSSTFAFPSSGKWYCEFTAVNVEIGYNQSFGVGPIDNLNNIVASYASNGQYYTPGVGWGSFGDAWSAGDVIGIAANIDDSQISYYKNGVQQGVTKSYTFHADSSKDTFKMRHGFPAVTYHTANFGQRPFAYTAPSGFKALCTTNLPAPVVTKPSEYFDVVTYAGSSSPITISGLEFSPDLVWSKNRSTANRHGFIDSVRGVNLTLASNITDGELSRTDLLTSFTSDGYTIGVDAGQYGWNWNGQSFVNWAWDAGSSTVSNDAGSITSQVRANASAGFSIVTYTGTGANATVGHGLNVAPSMIMMKCRSTSYAGAVYHVSVGNGSYLRLFDSDGTPAATISSILWNDTSPTSSVFSVGSSSRSNPLSDTMVAYCFAPVEGYSAFGSYTGNGSADGPFVYTGFRPRWILYKRTDSTADWELKDTARDAYNLTDETLIPNTAGAAYTGYGLDILSNGFKPRTSGNAINNSGGTYIYAAFAENPFALNARAR